MRSTIIAAAALVLLLVLAASAPAQGATISAALQPNTANSGSTLHVGVSGAAPELAGVVPESLTLGLQRGFAVDLVAFSKRCDPNHASIGDCPAASRIGGGHALVHASGLLTADVSAGLVMFLAEPIEAKDLASVVMRVDVGSRSRALRARLVAPAGGPFGYELRIVGVAATLPTIPGVVLSLRSLVLDLGARRTVTKIVRKRTRVTRKGKRVTVTRTVKRKVRRNLMRNPTTCAGSWGVRVTIRIAGSDRIRDLATPCSA